MATGHAVVLTTAGSAEEAERLARRLVTDGLAACVQRCAVASTYRWEGELVEEPEVLLVIKTRRERFTEIEAAVRELHSYETPELVCLEVEHGSADYLAWIDGVTGTAPPG